MKDEVQRKQPTSKSPAKAALAMINKGGLSSEQKMKVIKKAHLILSGK